MDPEKEAAIKREIDKMMHWIMWQCRETAIEFPSRVRVDVFFERGEGKSFYIESEMRNSPEFIADAERVFLEHEKKEIAKQALDFMKQEGTDDHSTA